LMAAVEWFWFEINKLPPPSVSRQPRQEREVTE